MVAAKSMLMRAELNGGISFDLIFFHSLLALRISSN